MKDSFVALNTYIAEVLTTTPWNNWNDILISNTYASMLFMMIVIKIIITVEDMYTFTRKR